MPKICRVVVVEDHGAVRELLGDVFAHEGYRFALAANAGEMRCELDKGDVDAVVIDIGVEKSCGIDLAAEAEAAGAVIVLTSTDEGVREILEQSGQRYLLKPYQLRDMLRAVDAALKHARSRCVKKKPLAGERTYSA